MFGWFRHLTPLKALLSPLGRGEDENLKTWSGVKNEDWGKQLWNLRMHWAGCMIRCMVWLLEPMAMVFFFVDVFPMKIGQWMTMAHMKFLKPICKIGMSCPASNLVSAENHSSPPGLRPFKRIASPLPVVLISMWLQLGYLIYIPFKPVRVKTHRPIPCHSMESMTSQGMKAWEEGTFEKKPWSATGRFFTEFSWKLAPSKRWDFKGTQWISIDFLGHTLPQFLKAHPNQSNHLYKLSVFFL